MDGYVSNTNRNAKGPRNRDAVVRGSLRWEPSSTWRTDLRVDYAHMRDLSFAEGANCPAQSAYGAPRGTCLIYLNSGQAIDSQLNFRSGVFCNSVEYDMTEVALSNKPELGCVTLTSLSSYFDHDYVGIDDLAPFPVAGVSIATTDLAAGTVPVLIGDIVRKALLETIAM